MLRIFLATIVLIAIVPDSLYAQSASEQPVTAIETIPPRIEERTIVIPLLPQSPEGANRTLKGDIKPEEAIYLHSKVKGSCYLLYAEHYHEAKTTKGLSGPDYNVDRIVLRSEIGGSDKSKTCDGTSFCARTEKEYNLGCRRSCTWATAYIGGIHWSTRKVCIW